MVDTADRKYGRSNVWLAKVKEVVDCMYDLRTGEEDEMQVIRAIAELEPELKGMPRPFADLAQSVMQLGSEVLKDYRW